MDSINDVFEIVKRNLKKREIDASYKLFIEPLRAGEYDFATSTIILYTNEQFVKQIVDTRFAPDIKEEFEKVLGFNVILKVMLTQDEQNTRLNVRSGEYAYTFDTFIVGPSNRLAHAMSLSIASKDSQDDQLYIYGPSGLGKTHLLKAIKTKVLEQDPTAKVILVSGEQFTNEFIHSISEGKTAEFQNRYRHADMLLVDDVQFIAGKDRTQEEFFHTFNALKDYGKRIVLVSDRAPKNIDELETRLISRFQQGLTADIQPPEFETRCAIVKRKAELLGMKIDQSVVEFIATKVTENIRQLEGVVKKLDAVGRIENRPPVMSTAHMVIKDILDEKQPLPRTIEKIIDQCAQFYNVSSADVRGNSRRQDISNARKMAMYVIKEVLGLTMEDIGKEFSGRDHSTVVASIASVKDKMDKENYFSDAVNDIINEIKK